MGWFDEPKLEKVGISAWLHQNLLYRPTNATKTLGNAGSVDSSSYPYSSNTVAYATKRIVSDPRELELPDTDPDHQTIDYAELRKSWNAIFADKQNADVDHPNALCSALLRLVPMTAEDGGRKGLSHLETCWLSGKWVDIKHGWDLFSLDSFSLLHAQGRFVTVTGLGVICPLPPNRDTSIKKTSGPSMYSGVSQIGQVSHMHPVTIEGVTMLSSGLTMIKSSNGMQSGTVLNTETPSAIHAMYSLANLLSVAASAAFEYSNAWTMSATGPPDLSCMIGAGCCSPPTDIGFTIPSSAVGRGNTLVFEDDNQTSEKRKYNVIVEMRERAEARLTRQANIMKSKELLKDVARTREEPAEMAQREIHDGQLVAVDHEFDEQKRDGRESPPLGKEGAASLSLVPAMQQTSYFPIRHPSHTQRANIESLPPIRAISLRGAGAIPKRKNVYHFFGRWG